MFSFMAHSLTRRWVFNEAKTRSSIRFLATEQTRGLLVYHVMGFLRNVMRTRFILQVDFTKCQNSTVSSNLYRPDISIISNSCLIEQLSDIW